MYKVLVTTINGDTLGETRTRVFGDELSASTHAHESSRKDNIVALVRDSVRRPRRFKVLDVI